MANQDDVFRVRLNCLDHYQAAPTSLDPPLWGPNALSSTQRSTLPHVPVIRVFGATETGQKVCAHIHGAFPYLYVPYTESPDQDSVDQFIATLRHSIDHALALSYRRNPYAEPRQAQFVAYISLVKGVPFFGYNVGYKYFLKIYMLNPMHMTRLADLLLQGAVMQRTFQPHEGHLQYLLQWMCDFNLYGCAFVETDKPRFRSPVPARDDLDDVTHLWHDVSIGNELMLDEADFPRQSHCQLELDFTVEDILNRHSIKARDLHQSFVERLASMEELPPEEKLVHSMAGLWKDETRRRKQRMGLTDPGSSPFPPEVLLSMSADPRNDNKGGWIHEEEFREMVRELANQEKQARAGGNITFDNFLSQTHEGDGVNTALQSVEELFHSNLIAKNAQVSAMARMKKQDDLTLGVERSNGTSHENEPLVDMSGMAEVVDEEDYGSDEEVAKTRALTQRPPLDDGVIVDIADKTAADNKGDVAGSEPDHIHPVDSDHDAGRKESAQSLKRPAPSATQGPFKRARFDIEQTQTSTKKVAFRVKDVPRGKRKADEQATDEAGRSAISAKVGGRLSSGMHSTQLPPSSQRSTQSQSSQSSRLDYPVVKGISSTENANRPSQKTSNTKAQSDKGSGSRTTSSFDGLHKSHSTTSERTSSTTNSEQPLVLSRLTQVYATRFNLGSDASVLMFGALPPSLEGVTSTLTPSVVYQDAYYSDERDVPERAREYAGQEFILESNTLPFLPEFDKMGLAGARKPLLPEKAKDEVAESRRRQRCTLKAWEIMHVPPTFAEVERWVRAPKVDEVDDLDQLEVDGPPATQRLARDTWAKPAAMPVISQIDGPTQKHKGGFKYSQHKPSTSVQHETGYMSTMSLEVHVNTRGELAPDPEQDEIKMVVWCLASEDMDEETKMGIVVLNRDDEDLAERVRHIVGNGISIDAEDNELDIINKMVDVVRAYDPDVLTGFEVHNGSWGYLIERARLQFEFNLPDEFSRMKSQSHGRFGKDADRWGFTHTSTVRITGRHTINIWRAMRSELNLLQYTMENIVFHLLHRRVPHYSFATLTGWYQSNKPRDLAKVLDYFMSRTTLDLEILDANELIPRTSEQARLLGVDFFSVFSRGSQFKVESLMFRIAKPESFMLVSPSRKQVGAQNALECIPLVMEPQSAFYSSPMLVLDFQSLYPSVMIAYNYCYSTCLGRIVNWRGTNKLGFSDFKRAPGLLELVEEKLNIAPNGLMYVKPEMRKSLLAKMLGEILETRVMVKSGMKIDKDDRTLQQLLNNRQLALKLIANVTYGYTSASFSGRMPCSEIADSIVQTGRETLEKAIALIHSVEDWGAEVVYGDTDSLFVYLKGRSRDDAFKIGEEIAKAVTDLNPRPVKLKFEKVYHPCVLLAKKRYVGFKYESPKQTEPEFDAKGIETVRRDGTPAEQKIEEKALKLLFRTADLSQVKRYFQQQCTKIMAGRISVQDFCFAKEVKLGSYADKGPAPPGAIIATRRMIKDPRSEPQYGERVPYVVIAGAPGARLWERCVEPERLLYDEQAELDAEYYISKNLIPPLERIFNLVGANVRQWYDEMPKVQRIRMLGGPREGAEMEGGGKGKARKTMESYMGSSLCLVCRVKLMPVPPAVEILPLPLCESCRKEQPQRSLLSLRRRLQGAEKRAADLEDVCRSCASLPVGDRVKCDSRDCPVFYSRVKADTQLGVARSGLARVLESLEAEEAALEK